MKPGYIALIIVYIIVCITMTVIVLMQEGKNAGISSLTGSADTYWSKNKGRSAEGKLVLITRILAAIFIILSLILAMNFWNK